MKLFILPGNAVKNWDWSLEVQKQLGGTIHEYFHWRTNDELIAFDYEVKKFAESVGEEDVFVIAKSVGCFVAMEAARQYGTKIVRAVFCGASVQWAGEHGIDAETLVKEWKAPSLFFHNDKDPVAPMEDLESLVPEEGILLTLEGNTHDYTDYDAFIPQVSVFFNPNSGE